MAVPTGHLWLCGKSRALVCSGKVFLPRSAAQSEILVSSLWSICKTVAIRFISIPILHNNCLAFFWDKKTGA